MTGRDGIKGKNRRGMAVLGGAVGAFAAAAAMATGSAVTAAPAKADFEDLLDPIIQPLITSLSDAIAGFDPTAAADLTSWTDSFLSSLNALDVAAPAAADPAAATTLTGSDVIPLSVAEGTEPTVDVSVDGSAPEATLVDTGSSGLLVPINDLSLTQLFDLGFPTGINSVSFSGGIDAFYLEYNDATVGYGDAATTTTTNTPIDVEFFSFPTSFSAGSPLDFQQFLTDDDSPGGILGIGASGETGPGTGPFEAVAGVSGVTVDEPAGELVVGSNAGTPIEPALDGAATPDTTLTETVTTSTGTLVGTATVSDDVDSGGVFGTIPSSIDSSALANGDVVTVSDDGTVLYQYTVADNGLDDAPTAVSGTSIDSGFAPFSTEPIFIGYGGTDNDGAITFDKP
jgi:PE-PGRS family protein with aspartyl peptidase-like domain